MKFKAIKSGYILLELLVAMALLFLLLPAAGKMLAKSSSVLNRAIILYHCRTIAQWHAARSLDRTEPVDTSFGTEIIKNIPYRWSRNITPWSGENRFHLVTIAVTAEGFRENYEISFIKKK
jgi:hypothetical protein